MVQSRQWAPVRAEKPVLLRAAVPRWVRVVCDRVVGFAPRGEDEDVGVQRGAGGEGDSAARDVGDAGGRGDGTGGEGGNEVVIGDGGFAHGGLDWEEASRRGKCERSVAAGDYTAELVGRGFV